MENAVILLVVVGLVVGILVISYVIRSAVNKGADAIHNSRQRKNNEMNAGKQENLSERYAHLDTSDNDQD